MVRRSVLLRKLRDADGLRHVKLLGACADAKIGMWKSYNMCIYVTNM